MKLVFVKHVAYKTCYTLRPLSPNRVSSILNQRLRYSLNHENWNTVQCHNKLALDTEPVFATANLNSKSHHSYLFKGENPFCTVQKSQPLRSSVCLSILATSYCAYSDPFATFPYSFLLGQSNGLKCINSPPHRESKGQNVLIPHLFRKAKPKSELIPHPLGQGKESKTPQSPTHAPCFPGVGVYSDRCITLSACKKGLRCEGKRLLRTMKVRFLTSL